MKDEIKMKNKELPTCPLCGSIFLIATMDDQLWCDECGNIIEDEELFIKVRDFDD